MISSADLESAGLNYPNTSTFMKTTEIFSKKCPPVLLYSFGEEGLVFFREVRSKNELIPTVCHTILINRPVSEVKQFPISRQIPRWIYTH